VESDDSPRLGTTPALNESQIKHLEFIQAVISRLSTDSFLMKGWAITIAGVIYSFAANHLNPWVAAVGFAPVVAFWFLDSYFVRKERQFRALYDDVRSGSTRIPPFCMNVNLCEPLPAHNWSRVARSVTLWPFYGLLLAVGVVLVVAGIAHDHKSTQLSRTSSAMLSLTSSDRGSLGGQRFPM
jgi:hypothetical protein